MSEALKDLACLVTGGTAGIGFEVARVLLEHGSSVFIVGRNQERLDGALRSLREQPGAEVHGAALDVQNRTDVDSMVEQAVECMGGIDLLVAAAGVLRAGGVVIRLLAETAEHEWDEVVDINLTGTYLTNRAVLRVMLDQGSGRIINVSSTSGRKGYAFDSPYCASKFALIGMTESLAAEVRPHGIRVNVVLPGAIETPMWEQNGPIPRPADILPSIRVADLIAHIAALPPDVELAETAIEPLKVHEPPAWMGSSRQRVKTRGATLS